MKKILFAMLVCSLYSVYTQAQCYDFYVKTPMNSNVKACTSGGYSSSQVQITDTYTRTYAISPSHVYEAGTNSYNCHGYAWHVKEGGNKVWINNVGYEYNNLSVYWTDESYFVYGYNSHPHVENLKVFYGNDDHTAITTVNPDIFISKMGCGALVGHYKDNSPYTEGNFIYYQKVPSISGPKLVLNAGSTYTLSGGSGGTVTWTYSSNLQMLSNSNTSITVKALSATSDGLGWIQSSVGGVSTPRYEVWVGKPIITGITIVNQSNNQYTFSAQYDHRSLINPARLQWILDPWFPFYAIGVDGIQITFNKTGNYAISVRATNMNGTGDYCTTGVSVNSSPYLSSLYRVSQDPASDELTVSPDTSVSQLSPLSPSSGASGSYTVYLYNTGGAVVKQAVSPQGGEVRLDVSGLPNGIYYLLIDAGNGAKPESHKIIINH